MSRFFVTGYSSESSTEEELLSSSEDEALLSSGSEDDQSEDSEFAQDSSDESESDSDLDASPKGPSFFLKKNFMKGAHSDSESDSDNDDRKVVKSAKEKLLDDIKQSIDSISKEREEENWSSLLSEFDKLGRSLAKAEKQNISTPNVYIKNLVILEDSLNDIASNAKETKKKMNAAESRAFNTLRQRVRKQVKEFQSHVDLYRSKPELFDSEKPVDIILTSSDAISGEKAVEDGTRFTSTPLRALSPVFSTLKQIAETRGKKNIDKYEQIQVLEDLLTTTISSGKPYELICVYQMLLSIRFDASTNQTFMPVEHWKKNEKDLNSFLDLLESKVNEYQVSESGTSTDEIDIEPEANSKGVKVIFGSITSFIERLDDELTRSLQSTDPHSIEYVERLKDESKIYNLIVRGQLYVESATPEDAVKNQEGNQLARIVTRRLEHIHYKPDQLIKANEIEAWKHIKEGSDSKITPRNSKPSEIINDLAKFLSENGARIYEKSALLYSIYYYAINNQYEVARNLFLSSQVFHNVNSLESGLQVMYNRALVQLGLSAFRTGNIEESHQILNEIVNSQRLKELLGQGFNSKYPSQATLTEKQKLLPFHTHINLELLECVFMTCSLLIEIPALAAASNSTKDSRRKTPIKSFKSKLDFHDRQYFTGPPESIKDHVIHASRALQKGNWLKAYNLLASIKIWKLFPDNDTLLSMMKNQLQIEGLRTYIFTYKSVFTKLSVSKLSVIFGIDDGQVINILEKMIQAGDINASMGESKKFVDFQTDEPQRTRLQELAIVMNEKVGLLTEKNEKTASNGYSRKPIQQKEPAPEETKFRYANVNTNKDEFQSVA